MKYVGISIIINICLLVTGVVGFSMTSLAVKTHCTECNHRCDSPKKSKADIKNKELCGNCAAKQKDCPEQKKEGIPNSDSARTITDSVIQLKITTDDEVASHAGTPLSNEHLTDDTTTAWQYSPHKTSPADISSSPLLAQLMQFQGAEETAVLPGHNRETSLIYAMYRNSNLRLLFNRPTLIKSGGEQLTLWHHGAPATDAAYTASSANTFPDFFITCALSEMEAMRPLLLLEKQTERTIEYTLKRVERSEPNSTEVLHMLIRNNSGFAPAITHYTLLVNKDVSKGTVVHLFDPETFTYYKLPGKKLPDFMRACKQWANKSNHILEIYITVHNTIRFWVPEIHEKVTLNHTTLKSALKVFCGKQAVANLKHKKTQYSQMLHDIKYDTSLIKKKIETSFSEWYQELTHTDTNKSFTITLSSTVHTDNNYTILITQLDKEFYGVHLLEENGEKQTAHKHYILFPKDGINILSKQFMFLFDNIEVHEITQ